MANRTRIEVSEEISQQRRTCRRCNIEKAFSEFERSCRFLSGILAQCRACRNEVRRENKRRTATPELRRQWSVSARYGLTPGDMRARREDQGGTCAICRAEMKKECVDHCHRTEAVRGLLCARCNTMLGAVERPGFLAAALAYLRKWGTPLPELEAFAKERAV